MTPKPLEIWALKSDSTKTLKVDWVNCFDIVGYSDAGHMKRSYGTLKMSAFLKRYTKA